MLNISSERAGVGGGVLIRGLEPREGIELMQRYRDGVGLLDLARGPGRLAAAMQINRSLDGLDLFSHGPLWLGELPPSRSNEPAAREALVAATVRIGITQAADRLFRFYERGSPFVSGPKRLLLGIAK